MKDSQAVGEAAEIKRLLSAREAAAVLGVSRATLCRLIKAKRIGVFRVGTRTLFDNSILENFMTTVYQPPSDATALKRKRTA
jgi:excisionase family DNA binding protein